MPKTAATALWPTAAAQTAASDRPSMPGSPAIGPTTGAAAGASGTVAGPPDSPAVASTVAITSLLHLERPAYAGLNASIRPSQDTCVLSLNQRPVLTRYDPRPR